MADDEKPKESGVASILGKDPKKRQMVAIGIGGVLLLVVYMMVRGKSSSAAAAAPSTSATTGGGTGTGVTAGYPSGFDPSQLNQLASNEQSYFSQLGSSLNSGFAGLQSTLAGMDTSQPGAAPTSTSSGNQDLVFGNHDAGQYMYGQAQLNYLQSNIGQFGITQQLVNQVQNAYNVVAQKMGATAANEAHYSIVDPSGMTIEAIPPDVVDARQIYTVHLSGSSANSGGTIDMGQSPQPWPTIWPQAGIVNPNASVSNGTTISTPSAS